MQTWIALVDVNENQIQNVQELASVWGDVRADIDEHEGQLQDAYALLGSRDYLVVFEAERREDAFKTSVGMERYGLDVETMAGIPVEDLGSLVDEI
jgi:uncharacterized protein with GYD domain